MTDLPDLSKHDEGDIRAWLYPHECLWVAAFDCPDLLSEVHTTLCLREWRDEYGRRRKGRKYGLRAERTPEQDARFRAASDLLNDKHRAMFSGRPMLAAIADLRRELWYAKRGETPPAVPSDPPAPKD